jgi:hypothetical protein
MVSGTTFFFLISIPLYTSNWQRPGVNNQWFQSWGEVQIVIEIRLATVQMTKSRSNIIWRSEY